MYHLDYLVSPKINKVLTFFKTHPKENRSKLTPRFGLYVCIIGLKIPILDIADIMSDVKAQLYGKKH
jgi:hypothetical protein